MEEDGTPDVGWWLTYEALALVRAARGDTGYLQLGPSSAPWGVPIVPGTMFHTAGNLAAAMSILGRRMIPGAHVFLRSMVGVQNIGNNPADSESYGG